MRKRRLRPRDVANLARTYELSDPARMMLDLLRREAYRGVTAVIPLNSPKSLATATELADAGLVTIKHRLVETTSAHFIDIDPDLVQRLAEASVAVEQAAVETGGEA